MIALDTHQLAVMKELLLARLLALEKIAMSEDLKVGIVEHSFSNTFLASLPDVIDQC